MNPVSFSFQGIDNIHDPASIKDTDSHGRHVYKTVVASMNFNLLDTLKCRTRRGRTNISATVYHSLYGDEERMLGCRNGILYDISTDIPAVRWTFARDHQLTYQQIPNASLVISNGEETVFMIGNMVSGFAVPPVTESIGAVDIPTNLMPMPGCYLMCWLNANLYIAVIDGNQTYVYYTDAWNFEGIPYTNNYPFPGLLTLMAATEDTIWISDATAIYSIADGKLVKKLDYPVIKNAFTQIPGEKLPVSDMTGTVIIASTPQGIVALGNGGQAKNLSIQTTTLPTADSGASGIIEQDGQAYYISSLNGIGTVFNQYNAASIDVEIYS